MPSTWCQRLESEPEIPKKELYPTLAKICVANHAVTSEAELPKNPLYDCPGAAPLPDGQNTDSKHTNDFFDDLAVNIGRNVIHGSDAAETAQFEIGLWFQASELNDWTPSDQGWRVES